MDVATDPLCAHSVVMTSCPMHRDAVMPWMLLLRFDDTLPSGHLVLIPF